MVDTWISKMSENSALDARARRRQINLIHPQGARALASSMLY